MSSVANAPSDVAAASEASTVLVEECTTKDPSLQAKVDVAVESHGAQADAGSIVRHVAEPGSAIESTNAQNDEATGTAMQPLPPVQTQNQLPNPATGSAPNPQFPLVSIPASMIQPGGLPFPPNVLPHAFMAAAGQLFAASSAAAAAQLQVPVTQPQQTQIAAAVATPASGAQDHQLSADPTSAQITQPLQVEKVAGNATAPTNAASLLLPQALNAPSPQPQQQHPQGLLLPRPHGHQLALVPQVLAPNQQMFAVPPSSAPGRRGAILYMPTDDDVLAENQILLRRQIEFFEAKLEDVGKTTSGRRRPIMLGQVGIQCRHCADLPVRYRQRGAVYYPAKLKGIYQAAQNMAVTHLCESCEHIDPQTRNELRAYQKGRSTTGHGGKEYWAKTARAQGVIDTEEGGLRFAQPPT